MELSGKVQLWVQVYKNIMKVTCENSEETWMTQYVILG